MMRAFTTGELSQMQGTQEGAMQDRCKILSYSSSADSYGNPSASYTAGSEITCGLELVNPDEVQESGEVPVIDAVLRVALGTTIDERDRVQVTQRYGSTITAQTYEVVGPVRRGPSGLRVGLALVTEE